MLCDSSKKLANETVKYQSPLHRCLEVALAQLDVELGEAHGNAVRNQSSVRQVAAASNIDVEPIGRKSVQASLRCGDVVIGGSAEQVFTLSQAGFRVRRFWADKHGSRDEPVSLRQILSDDSAEFWVALRPMPSLEAITSPAGNLLSPWRRLLGLARLEGKDVRAVVLYAGALGVLSLAVPVAIQALVNTVAFGGVLQPLLVLIIALFIGLSMAATLQVLQAYVAEILQRRFMVRVAEDIGNKLTRANKDLQDSRDLSELNNRFFDVITIQKSTTELLLAGSSLALQTGIGILLLAFYHPWLMVFSVVLIASIGLVAFLGRGGLKTAQRESIAKFAIGGWLDELARNPSLFASGPGREFCSERLTQRVAGYIEARKNHYRHVLAVLIGGVSVQALSVVLVLGFGGYLVMERQLTLGQLVAAELVVGAIAAGIGKFGRLAEKTFDSAAALDKLGKLFDLPSETSGFVPFSADAPIDLSADSLGLSRAGAPIATMPIAIRVKPGDRLLIRGSSGSGVTTLLETLSGQRQACSGTVAWNRVQHPDRDQLARHIVLLAEQSFMAGSVLDNLRVAEPNLQETEAWECLRRVGLSARVEALGGLGAKLHSIGAPLSSDDRKRLLLARAWAAKPRLLLIDHTLDLDDARARRELAERFLGAEAPWTAVVASRHDDIAIHCSSVHELRPIPNPDAETETQ